MVLKNWKIEKYWKNCWPPRKSWNDAPDIYPTFSIVFSRSWTPQRVWFLKLGKYDPISAAIRRDLHWLPIQARIRFKMNVITRNCLVGQAPEYLAELCRPINEVPARRNLRSRHKFSSWSLVFVRNVPVDVVSPSHPHNCGIYFQSTFEFYTRSHICSERDWKLISCSSPFFTTEDLCHQCDIYYYFYYIRVCAFLIYLKKKLVTLFDTGVQPKRLKAIWYTISQTTPFCERRCLLYDRKKSILDLDLWKVKIRHFVRPSKFWPALSRERHCGLVGSAPAWDGTGCEFDSWQCRIYIPWAFQWYKKFWPQMTFWGQRSRSNP